MCKLAWKILGSGPHRSQAEHWSHRRSALRQLMCDDVGGGGIFPRPVKGLPFRKISQLLGQRLKCLGGGMCPSLGSSTFYVLTATLGQENLGNGGRVALGSEVQHMIWRTQGRR